MNRNPRAGTPPIRVIISAVLLLALTLGLPAGRALAATTVYVATTGDDVGGDGSAGNPFKTITRGLAAVGYGDTVQAAPGTYDENISLATGVLVQGSGAGATTIRGAGSGPVVSATNVGSSARIDGFTITGGNAANGGGVYLSNSSPTISNDIIATNTASNSGGGIYGWSAGPTVSNSAIYSNTAAGGGGIYLTYSNLTLQDSVVSTNTAGSSGGGIYIYCSPFNVRRSVIGGNSASSAGGIYIDWYSDGTINRTLIAQNRATGGDGGGLASYTSSPQVTSSVIASNSASGTGGGVYLSSSGAVIAGDTIVSNSASGGGGVYGTASSPTIFDAIIWGNGDDLANVSATYSDIEDGDSGTGNIALDPKFVDAASGDYHIGAGSPSIDSGTNTGAPTADKDGVSRPQDGDNSGSGVVDMGAYERPYMAINGGAAYTGSTGATIASNFVGASRMRLRNAGDAWPGWEAYSSERSWTLASGEGSKTVEVEYDFGGATTVVLSDSIMTDMSGPSGSIAIAGGAGYTNTTSVSLTLSATDATSGVSRMRLSNDGVFDGGPEEDWQNYASSLSWTLASGEGTKTVYVQYRDGAGNVSDTFSDTIVLDTQAPWGSITINGGDFYATTTTVSLDLPAGDAGSGVAKMRLSNDGVFDDEPWVDYETPKSWVLSGPDGMGYVYVQYKDASGRVSADFYDWVYLDTGVPTGSVQINSDAAYTVSHSVNLSLPASDLSSGVAKMRLSNDGVFDGGPEENWQNYASSLSWTLASGEETKTVYVQYKDDAGNESPVYSDEIYVDTTIPTGSVVIDGGATYATSTTVNLALSATDTGSGIEAMRVSNDGAFDTEPPESFVTSKSWVLPGPDGSKTVYVQYSDAAGNTDVFSDTIILDTQIPARPAGFRAVAGDGRVDIFWTNAGGDFAATRVLRSLGGYASSPAPGGDQSQIYEGVEETTTDTAVTNGAGYFYTAFSRDQAGNWSVAATAAATPSRPTTLSIDVGSNRNWNYGDEVPIKGALKAVIGGSPIKPGRLNAVEETLAGREVTLWKSSNGASWSQDSTMTYDPATTLYEATFTITAKTFLQLRFAGEPAYGPSVSANAVVASRAYLGMPRTAPSVPTHGQYFYTYGNLKPRHYGYTRLYFYRRVYYRGRYVWRYFAHKNATNYNYSTYTRYRLYYRLPYPGKWYVRAYHSDGDHLATWSPIRRFSVR